MNEFVFTSMRRVFVRFLEEIEDTKKTFQNYLTFKNIYLNFSWSSVSKYNYATLLTTILKSICPRCIQVTADL